jgi:hypothetical protein
MRFLIPAQTIAEYRHRKMPMFETMATVAVVAAAGVVGAGASYGLSQLNKPPGYKAPSPQMTAEEQQMLISNAASAAMLYAPEFTQQNIDLQNRVTPGSSAQRKLALNQLNSYIKGEIPLDVQQNINRQVAQNLGGGFNLYSGGGQAPQNFARNLGQTSLGLSQYGLSAAPTWQQLANSMVASPTQLFGSALQAGEFAAGNQTQQAENQYQSGMNKYAAQQQAIQSAVQTGVSSASMAGGMMNSARMANYYGGMGSGGASYNPGQGYMNTMMGTGYSSPAASTSFAQSAGALPSVYSSGASFGSGLNPALNYTSGLTFG